MPREYEWYDKHGNNVADEVVMNVIAKMRTTKTFAQFTMLKSGRSTLLRIMGTLASDDVLTLFIADVCRHANTIIGDMLANMTTDVMAEVCLPDNDNSNNSDGDDTSEINIDALHTSIDYVRGAVKDQFIADEFFDSLIYYTKFYVE